MKIEMMSKKQMRIDLRHTQNTVYCLWSTKCGCKCQSCGWRGYRIVKVLLNLGQRVSTTIVTSQVKDKRSIPNCPKCDYSTGKVMFTHVAKCR